MIERLRNLRRKFNMTGTMKQLRARREFTKKSVELRNQKIKAAYKETLREKKTSYS